MGCSTTKIGDAGYRVPVYSDEQRQSVYNEMVNGCCPMTIEMLKDYKVLRDQVRVK